MQFLPIKSVLSLAASIGVLTLSLVLSSPVSAQITAEIVMSGLNNPRGLAVASDGSVVVAEAGTGAFGTGAGSPPFITGPTGASEFYGETGSVSRLSGGVQSRVISGLASMALVNGTDATGLQDIVFDGSGVAYGVMGSPGGLAARTSLTTQGAVNADKLGRLARLDIGAGTASYFADFVQAEDPTDPDGSGINSNPYGLAPLTTGGFAAVDAGANALYTVASDLNTLSLVTTFAPKANPTFNPGNPATGGPFYQAVPTAVTLGSDGSYFVSQLAGYPFVQGGAEIYNIPAGGTTPTAVFSGFTMIIDLAFGADGQLYVLQLNQNGLGPQSGGNPGPSQLIRVDPLTGTKTVLDITLPGDLRLNDATGIAFGADSSLYVSNRGTQPGTGQVVRLTGVTVPEPGTGLLALAALASGAVAVMARRRK